MVPDTSANLRSEAHGGRLLAPPLWQRCGLGGAGTSLGSFALGCGGGGGRLRLRSGLQNGLKRCLRVFFTWEVHLSRLLTLHEFSGRTWKDHGRSRGVGRVYACLGFLSCQFGNRYLTVQLHMGHLRLDVSSMSSSEGIGRNPRITHVY